MEAVIRRGRHREVDAGEGDLTGDDAAQSAEGDADRVLLTEDGAQRIIAHRVEEDTRRIVRLVDRPLETTGDETEVARDLPQAGADRGAGGGEVVDHLVGPEGYGVAHVDGEGEIAPTRGDGRRPQAPEAVAELRGVEPIEAIGITCRRRQLLEIEAEGGEPGGHGGDVAALRGDRRRQDRGVELPL